MSSSNPQLSNRSEETLRSLVNVHFAMVDASLDQYGKSGAGMVLYYDTGQMQLIHFTPIEAITPFQAEVIVLKLAIRGWSSPYLQRPKKILTDCKSLVNFLNKYDENLLPCWQGARAAFECLEQLRSTRHEGFDFDIYFLGHQKMKLAHDLVNVARRTGGSFIRLPSLYDL
jgi:hypothetical protein